MVRQPQRFVENGRYYQRVLDASLFRPPTKQFPLQEQDKFLVAKVDGYLPRRPGWDWRDREANVVGNFETQSFQERGMARYALQQGFWRNGKRDGVFKAMQNFMRSSSSQHPSSEHYISNSTSTLPNAKKHKHPGRKHGSKLPTASKPATVPTTLPAKTAKTTRAAPKKKKQRK